MYCYVLVLSLISVSTPINIESLILFTFNVLTEVGGHWSGLEKCKMNLIIAGKEDERKQLLLRNALTDTGSLE